MPHSTIARRDLLRVAGLAGLTLLPTTAVLAQSPPAAQTPTEPAKFARIKIGAIEGVVLSDGAVTVAPIQPTFGYEVPPDELTKALDRAFHPRDHAGLEFNAAVFRIGKDLVLVDTGNGGSPGAVGKMRANLLAAGVKPEDIRTIVITHAHTDHIGGLTLDDGSLAYPNAKILIGKAEHAFWTTAPNLSTSRLPEERKKEMTADIQKRLAAVKTRIETIDPGAKIFDGVEVIDTSGHTPGHLSLMFSSGADQMCLLGDVAHNHVIMFANPAWPTIFDTDQKLAATNRAKIFDRLAADRTRVLAYHLPWPGLGHIRRDGSGFEWIMQAWGEA